MLDVNALKTMKCRGQAHIAFRDVISATQAMRALHGVNIYGKDMVCTDSECFAFAPTPPS